MAMRVEGKCIGDCSKCQLLANGEVDMIPCVLDQTFQRIRRMEKRIENLSETVSQLEKKQKFISLAGCAMSTPEDE